MEPVVLITGGSRGIGAACAFAFAQAGYQVAIGYRDSRAQAQELASRLTALWGHGALAVQGDVAQEEDVAEMFRLVRRELGEPQVLLNSAGICWQGVFQEMTAEEWDRLFAVDVRGVFLCCRQAVEGMLRRGSGRIINISSMWGTTGASCEAAYSAAKAAVDGFTKALAKELGPSGITVNAIAPGLIDTDMNAHLGRQALEEIRLETPLERLGRPEDVAAAAVFLASPGASFITGQILGCNGGLVI